MTAVNLRAQEYLARQSALAVMGAVHDVRKSIKGPVSMADEAIMAGAAGMMVKLMIEAFGEELASRRIAEAVEMGVQSSRGSI